MPSSSGPSLRLVNHSGYDSGDLRRFLRKALRAMKVRRPVTFHIWAAPGRSKGCADIGGRNVNLALAPPSKGSLRRLACVVEHELAHVKGVRHEQMGEALLYSTGPLPGWARGSRIRYLGRAPRQLPLVRAARTTRA